MRRPLAVALASAFLACSNGHPSEGHIVLFIDTDAPLIPPRKLVPDLGAPVLFDKLKVEFFSATDTEPCPTCTRDFDAYEDLFARGASVTVRGNVDRARVRLYRAQDQVDGEMSTNTTLEVVARLPPVPGEGPLSVSVLLETARVGRPNGTLTEPIAVTSGPPDRPHVGTWPHAEHVPCAGAARTGEVCVPGGAFFMGSSADDGDILTLPQRLVVLSPFFLDDHEVTIGAISDWIAATKKDVRTVLIPWNDPDTPDRDTTFCTYGRPNRELPVNCMTKGAALEYCQSLGKNLPTDAQLEYVSGALKSSPYVWGKVPPKCGEAVWGVRPDAFVCEDTSPTGPIAHDQLNARTRDVLRLSTGKLYDLAGNLSELALDVANLKNDPCWTRPEGAIFRDPVCTRENAPQYPGFSMMRGGSWNDDLSVFLRSTLRQAVFAGDADPAFLGPETGFRCARKP